MTADPKTGEFTEQPTVVVIGGGYGGVNLAKALDDDTNVVLVEPKDAFVHSVAALRALVEPEFAPRMFLPYNKLLTRGRVEHDRAIRVSPGRVVLASGKEIAADYIVLATGSNYPFPAKSDVDSTRDALEKYRAAYDRLQHAERVLLIGAGAVGIELAGEIKSTWPYMQVILLDVADDVLGDEFRPDLRAELRAQLEEIGVELALGEGLRTLPAIPATELRPFVVATESGREISADMWFKCFGVSPVSDYLDDDLASARGADGFVKVGPALQVAGQETVFAIGDVSTADAKMAGRAGRQAHLVAANIRKLMIGDHDLSPYEPIPPAIIVPIGPDLGSGQLPGAPDLASREMVSAAKGQDLMVDRYAEIMGLKAPDAPA
jgi:NADH dehydrogenase FAD-containing subunit